MSKKITGTKTFKTEEIDGLEVVCLDEEVEQEGKQRKGLPIITLASLALGASLIIGGAGAVVTNAGGNTHQQFADGFIKGTDEEEQKIGSRKLAVLTDIKDFDITVSDNAVQGYAIKVDKTTGDPIMTTTEDGKIIPTYAGGNELLISNAYNEGGEVVDSQKDGEFVAIKPVANVDYDIEVAEVLNDHDGTLWAAVVTENDDGTKTIIKGANGELVQSAPISEDGKATFAGKFVNPNATLKVLAKFENDGEWYEENSTEYLAKVASGAQIVDYKYEDKNATVYIYTEQFELNEDGTLKN